MILDIKIDNYLVYSNEVELSMEADMRIKKFSDNVCKQAGKNILKSTCLFGANNSGKSSFIRGINTIKNVLLSYVAEVTSNIFNDSKVCSFGITFTYDDSIYNYEFKYDSTINNGVKNGFIFESLKEILVDKYGNTTNKQIFLRDVKNNKFQFINNENLSNFLRMVSTNNILIYTISSDIYPEIAKYKDILRNFALSIDILEMDNIPIDKTIDILKNNESIVKQVVNIIKFADIDIDDYVYNKGNINLPKKDVSNGYADNLPQENVLKINNLLDDMFRLTSIHKGRKVSSIVFDSNGTKKIVALAGFIVDSLKNNRILVVDELDSSLHFKITRAIVSLFNNYANKNSQLIFTAHDVTLLDCKKLFRKDQIWFVDKNDSESKIYALSSFNALNDHVRSESNIYDLYIKGNLGAIPEPDLIDILLEINEGKND